MVIRRVLKEIINSPSYRGVESLARHASGTGKMLVTGILPLQKSMWTAALAHQLNAEEPSVRVPIVLVTPGERAARAAVDDLLTFLPEHMVLHFPALELWPHEQVAEPADVSRQRLEGLTRLVEGPPPAVVVLPARALAQALVPPHAFKAFLWRIGVGERIDVGGIQTLLAERGYTRVPKVESPGEFSLRGDVLDVWPTTEMSPLRIEFFDDEVDSVRRFDADSQRSLAAVDEAVIAPTREVMLPTDRPDVERSIMASAEKQKQRLESLDLAEAGQTLLRQIEADVTAMREGTLTFGRRRYLPFLYDRLASFLDYVPDEALIVIDEPLRAREQINLYVSESATEHSRLLEQGKVLPDEMALSLDWDRFLRDIEARRTVFFSTLHKTVPDLDGIAMTSVSGRSPEHMHGRMDAFIDALREWMRLGFKVTLITATQERLARLRDVLIEADLHPEVIAPEADGDGRAPEVNGAPGNAPVTSVQDLALQSLDGAGNGHLRDGQAPPADGNGAAPGLGRLSILLGHVQSGCEWPDSKWVVLSDAEIFGHRKQRRRVRADAAARLRDVHDLSEGDYVVHVNHGIGRYLGVQTMEVAGVHKDYLMVEYSGGDKLYVPTDQVDLLQRYIGVEGQAPRLYRLGGGEWARVKRRVKESVQEMAEKLLRLYAEREATEGHAFQPDSLWQQEFEDRFQYQETPDQWQAIQDVKADMERKRPMDRLLCGDVGYGKTEVAVRAAFKAVLDSKQVVVLVPTTILAQQHHRTFSERFEGYPIEVRVLSRFQTAAEQRAILKDLAAGKVDVVIGTHRLLSKDVEFHDLGLVIVDEEQRFGVAQKERLKELRKSVDVLTLSATPIPRTLHMSLVGMRDMSLIETPPEDRYPIRTYVVEYDDETVREAILRELERNGQVYFVYNRVRDIERMAGRLRELVPEARIAVAHGQMDEERLERVMLQFLEHEFDVLLCSTIIETGMDISNVNTLIVYDADQMGLAQLYQLRGRVGRTNRVAHAYFTYERDKVLSEDAEKRLQAIKEFTDLGSGFKVAMRDLEIRGAGNILGAEQHGFIASVGFELYCKLLDESIKELRGELVPPTPDATIELNVDAFIPDEYVPDSRQKVELYKKVMGVSSPADADELEAEIRDRFGRLPEPVSNLLIVARIKALGRQAGLQAISQEGDTIVLRYLPDQVLSRDTAVELSRRYRNRVGISLARPAQIKLRARDMSDTDILMWIEAVLDLSIEREAALVGGA